MREGKVKKCRRVSHRMLAITLVLVMSMTSFSNAVKPTRAAEDTTKVTDQDKDTFVHPGMIHTAESFAKMKENIDNQVQPNLDTWNALWWDGFSNPSWNPRLLENVVRGISGSNNYAQFYIDIRRAYQTALVWNVSGSADHGEAACRILNGWSSTLKSITGSADRFLAAGIYGYELANAAEIMRNHPSFDQEAMENLLLNVFYPMNNDFLKNHNTAHIGNYWANWDLCNIASMMSIGIFCDREDIYNQALEYYKTGLGNGSIYNAMPYVYDDGTAQWQESGRDQGHTTFGISLCEVICEMAWNQGDDLYGLSDNRLMKAAEYVAKYNNGVEVQYSAYEWLRGQTGTSNWQPGISGAGRGSVRPIYSMIYNHYVNRKGLSMPTLEKILYPEGSVYIEGAQGNGDELGWQSLTFANLSERVEDKPISGDFEDGIYRIRSVLSGKTLVVNEEGNLASAAVGSRKDEWWYLKNKGDGEYIVTNMVTGKVMQVNNNFYAYGSLMGTAEATGGLNQNIAFVKNATGDYRIIPTINYLVVGLDADRTEDDTPVIQWRNYSNPSQRFVIESAAEMGVDFSFDDEESGLSSGFASATGNYSLENFGDGKALRLDGVDDYLTVVSPLEGNVLAGAKEMTLSFDVNTEGEGENWIFYGASTEVDGKKDSLSIFEKDGELILQWKEDSSLMAELSTEAPTDWYQVIVTASSDAIVLYINGEEKARQEGEYDFTNLSDENSVMYIGKGETDQYYQGLMDNVVITAYEMKEAEIIGLSASYSANKLPEVLAEFTFDNDESGFQSEHALAKGYYSVTDHDDGKALYLNGWGDFLTVTAKDGKSLLYGGAIKEMTISLQAKPEDGIGWVFYAAPDNHTQDFNNEKYLGVLDNNGSMVAERYYNTGIRSASAIGTSKASAWHHLVIVYTKGEIVLYDDGAEIARTANATELSDVLGVDSILYIGKANWGNNGEFFRGSIDNYKILSKAWTAEEVKTEYQTLLAKSEEKDEGSEDSDQTGNQDGEQDSDQDNSQDDNQGSDQNNDQDNKDDNQDNDKDTKEEESADKPTVNLPNNQQTGTKPSQSENVPEQTIIKKNELYIVKNYKYKIVKADMTGKGAVTLVGIKNSTKAKKMKKITVPKTVKIKGISFKVTAIGKKAFVKCKKVKRVTIGVNVRSIGKKAFYGCKKLSKVSVKGKKLKKVGKSAFKKLNKKVRFVLPKKKKKAYEKLLRR